MAIAAELERDWRHILPAGIRPYTEAAPISALFLGISSGFPYAMIGATLTTRLKQDGIDKATITAFTLAFLVYNLKPLWSWVVDGIRLPLLGRLLRDLYAARFARTLSTMVSSRLPLVEGLKLTVPTIRNAALAGATAHIVDQVRAGGGLSAALRDAGVFPPLLVYMTASGESAGRLEVMLERAADYLEREFDRFTAASMALLEPVIIVVMGSCVALIILAILLPILQLQNLAGL